MSYLPVKLVLEDFYATLTVAEWARGRCPSFVDYSRNLVIGTGLVNTFNFTDEKDVIIFTLRWL